MTGGLTPWPPLHPMERGKKFERERTGGASPLAPLHDVERGSGVRSAGTDGLTPAPAPSDGEGKRIAEEIVRSERMVRRLIRANLP